MNKKSKKITLLGALVFFSVVVVALGIRYFPFTRVIKLPAAAEKEFVNPQNPQTQAPNSLGFDFEVAPGKDMPDGFYKGLAHSGQYSVKAFGQNSYSLTIERPAKAVGIENLKAVAVSAWIYLFPTTNEVKGTFVFAASNELGVNVFWQGVEISGPEVPQGKWFKISGYFDLASVNFKPDYKLQFYFWNNSRTDILVDDYCLVFGGPVDRRGDSALVDMTRGAPGTPPNPPFPVVNLELIATTKPVSPEKIPSGIPAISGNFLGNTTDDLLTTGYHGELILISFCQSGKEFRPVRISNTEPLASLGKIVTLLKGNFLPGTVSQFILSGEKSWALAGVEPLRNSCTEKGPLQTTLKIYWKSDSPMPSTLAGDFNGDRRSEIIVLDPNGSWKMISFVAREKEGGAWNDFPGQNPEPIPEWDRNKYELEITPGRFMKDIAHDVLLTVVRSKKDGKKDYTLRKFTAGHWVPLFPEKQGYCGKTSGLDTLGPDDRFFLLHCAEANETRIFRYDRHWRFDLKEIRFNDSSFQTLAAVDFHGYPKDHNPKYYESLSLAAGNFIHGPMPGFFVTGHIAAEKHYEDILPGFSALYSLPETGKK